MRFCTGLREEIRGDGTDNSEVRIQRSEGIMKDFVFCNPTKIVFGDGVVEKVGEETKKIGRKVLLVYGRSHAKETGLCDRVVKSLADAGVEIVEFPGVRPNPILSHTREGIALAKKEQVDAILAVGGGSVIDESKTIAVGAVTDTDVWDFFTGVEDVESAMPIGTVLTIPATGSEMNGGMVVTDETAREKFGFGSDHTYPKFSILDPTLTYSIPADQTAYGAVDAAAHLLEGYFTHQDEWAPIQDRYVEALIKTIMETVEIILAKPDDYQGRATMMWAATLAWNELPLAGVGPAEIPNHLLEHPLSGFYDIPHAAGLSVVIPAWATWTLNRRDPSKIARFGRVLFDIDENDDREAAKEAVGALKAWYEKIGSPTSLEAAGISSPEFEALADHAVKLAELWEITSYTKDEIIEIYRLCTG